MENRAFQLHFRVALLTSFVVLTVFPCSGICCDQRESRDEEVTKLLQIARDSTLRETNPNRAAEAIKRLGELKAEAAINDLTQLLTFRIYEPWERDPNLPRNPSHPMTSQSRYPAVGALVEIGKPALPAIVKVIETHEPGSLEAENAMEVLIYMSTYERSKYVDYLEDEVSKAPTPVAAERLRKAAETLKECKR